MNPNEWFNQNLPLANSAGMKDIAALRVGPVATSVDLRALFGKAENGHLYTLKFESSGVPTGVNARAYFALSPNPITINEAAVGTSSGVCWPLLDGQEIRGSLMSGRELATGIATMTSYPVLNFKAPAGGGTGYLRVYRSSVSAPQGSEQFPIPSGVLAI